MNQDEYERVKSFTDWLEQTINDWPTAPSENDDQALYRAYHELDVAMIEYENNA